MPNKDVLKKWVSALRSGEYQQTTGTLGDLVDGDTTPKYCCLGVLCELGIKEGLPINRSIDRFHDTVCYDGEQTLLPVKIQEWVGTGHNIKVKYGEDDVVVSSLNDSVGLSFVEIADLIEQTWLTEKTTDGQ